MNKLVARLGFRSLTSSENAVVLAIFFTNLVLRVGLRLAGMSLTTPIPKAMNIAAWLAVVFIVWKFADTRWDSRKRRKHNEAALAKAVTEAEKGKTTTLVDEDGKKMAMVVPYGWYNRVGREIR